MGAAMRTLSPPSTLFVKFVFPALWFALGMVFLVVIKDPLPDQDKTIVSFVIAWLFGFIIMLLGVGMKRVRTDGTFLYVSNYQSEIKVPLSEIADVSESRRIAFPTITVHFRAPTEFGRDISFMTPARFGKPAGTLHPLVDELKQLAQQAALQQSSP
jgi:hypothetical protein